MNLNYIKICLSFLIIISTSGIPLVYHLCEINGISVNKSCEICEEFEFKNTTCCDAENPYPFNTYFTDNNSHCCHSKIIENRINDEFLISQFESKVNLKYNFTLILYSLIDEKFPKNTFHIYTDTSPPIYNQTELNILFSTFLI